MRNTFNRLAVLTALFFMVCELAYVNAKSLLFIVDEFGFIDKVFAVIGSLAFSMVTIIIMRRGEQRWLKFVFPFFDVALVFCGFNLKFANSFNSNWVAFSLTIFMAVFTGLITYSLGTLSYYDSKGKDEEFITQTVKAEFQDDIQRLTKQCEKYKEGYYRAEISRIRKKKEKNRTAWEREILDNADNE